MKYNHRQCQLVSFSFFSYTYCRIQYWFRISKRNALTQTGETYRTCCTWFCGRSGLKTACQARPLSDDSPSRWCDSDDCLLVDCRTPRRQRRVHGQKARRKRNENMQSTVYKERERKDIRLMETKVFPYGRRNKRKSTRSTFAARLTAAATNILLILNNSFFSFDLALSLHFSDTSVCSHQLWNRYRPKQFSPKDLPAGSLG